MKHLENLMYTVLAVLTLAATLLIAIDAVEYEVTGECRECLVLPWIHEGL